MTALVTGASGGLGREVAAALAAAGHDIAVHWRTDEAGARSAAAGVEGHGRRAHLCRPTSPSRAPRPSTPPAPPCSTTPRPPSARSTSWSSAAAQDLTPWDDLVAADWDTLYRAGLRSAAVLLHAAGARMRPGGVIVTIGSIEGLRPARGHAPYAVTKAALHHLTVAAAYELGPLGVRVVGVAPGLVDRPGSRRTGPTACRDGRRPRPSDGPLPPPRWPAR